MIANARVVANRPLTTPPPDPHNLGHNVVPAPPVGDPTAEELLAKTNVVEVRLTDIDLKNEAFTYREGRQDPPCEPLDLVVNHGVVDFSAPHPALLWCNQGKYEILNGRARIEIAANRPDITAIRCRVVEGGVYDATVAAARANIQNAAPLKRGEKKRAFLAEWTARREAGLGDLKLRGWGKIYGVHHSTVSDWQHEVVGIRQPELALSAPAQIAELRPTDAQADGNFNMNEMAADVELAVRKMALMKGNTPLSPEVAETVRTIIEELRAMLPDNAIVSEGATA